MNAAQPLLVCNNLTKIYDYIRALNNLNLHLYSGRIVGLLGPNGSGKTTLIKILAGLLQPTSGNVSINGNAIGPETKTVVSYLPDKMYFSDWMTASDLINLFSDFYSDFRRERATAMCQNLGVGLNMKVKNMSKGTQEKVQLILAMSREAKLYLLDEPIAAVDPAARQFILNTILANCSPNSTILISTHLLMDVEPILNEAIFLKEGSIVCYDSVENIRKNTGKSLSDLFIEIFRAQFFGGAW